APASRRATYELLIAADAKAADRLLPTMIEDPSVEIRREAIAAAIEKARPLIKSDAPKAAKEFEKLFHASRDIDQTESIAKILKELKVESDMHKHFGIISDWMLVGPFDSTKGNGYPKSYPPETKVDLAATCKGKEAEVKWQAHKTSEPLGVVDLNKAIGKHKDACAYAFAAVEAEKPMPAEIRLSSITAVKVFLNGKEVFAREEYHH